MIWYFSREKVSNEINERENGSKQQKNDWLSWLLFFILKSKLQKKKIPHYGKGVSGGGGGGWEKGARGTLFGFAAA